MSQEITIDQIENATCQELHLIVRQLCEIAGFDPDDGNAYLDYAGKCIDSDNLEPELASRLENLFEACEARWYDANCG